MNLLFRVVFATHCRSTHHKIAMDALRHLRGPDARLWQRLLLANHAEYLRGAKAPDAEFRDFRNHVLHVGDRLWGGARNAARKWYDRTVVALKERRFSEAAYAAGVVTHYYTDPIQPFHTGQSEAETNIHRATEWSITKSYDTLQTLIATRVGYPQIEDPSGEGWLEAMVVEGARASHRHYNALVERYDFAAGSSNPPKGLDDTCRLFLAELVAHAQVGVARILDRAVAESGVAPPPVSLSLGTLLATLRIPIRWVTRKLADAKDQAAVEAMYREYQATGKVEQTLGEDERAILESTHAEQGAPQPTAAAPRIAPSAPMVAPRPVAPPPPSTLPLTNAPISPQPTEKRAQLRFYLELDDEVEDAPSIGPKTARRLGAIGIHRVSDLLAADPEETAEKLGVRHIRAKTIRRWQTQAVLVCQIAYLRGHDAQILEGSGYETAAEVAAAEPDGMLTQIGPFVRSSEGKRVLRSSKQPDREEVSQWIRYARSARTLRAA